VRFTSRSPSRPAKKSRLRCGSPATVLTWWMPRTFVTPALPRMD